MEHLTQPTLWALLFQSLLWTAHIPGSYLAYRWVRVPMKRTRVKQSLAQLGIVQTEELEDITGKEYRLRHYFWPLVFAWVVTLVVYVLTHPYAIQSGWWAGTLEEVINVFDADDFFPRAILAGRFLFWGWAGAYIYSFHLIFRRLVAYDLTPTVYFFAGNRFALAFVVGSIAGVWIGTSSTAAGVPFDVNIATVSLVVFFVGFFPEQGINWITATAKKTLRQQGGIAKEKPLSDIEGLSIWHQGRLKQEGIENVQNLATADVPALVISTPFTVNQIVDWVDQAILLVYASQEQFEAMENVGLRCASDVLTAAGDGRHLNQLADATGLSKNGVGVLHLALQSASNMAVVSRFRWQSSMDSVKREEAAKLRPFEHTLPEAIETLQEQEASIKAELNRADSEGP